MKNKKTLFTLLIVIAAIIGYLLLSNDEPKLTVRTGLVPSFDQPLPQPTTAALNRAGRHLYVPGDTAGLAAGKKVYNEMLNAAKMIAKKTKDIFADSLIAYAVKHARICVPVDDYSVRSLEPVDTGSYFLPVVILQGDISKMSLQWQIYNNALYISAMFEPNVLAMVLSPIDSISSYGLGTMFLHELQHAYSHYTKPYNKFDPCLKYLDEQRSYQLEFKLAAKWGKLAYERALQKEKQIQQSYSMGLKKPISTFFIYSDYDYSLDGIFGKALSGAEQSNRMLYLGMNATLQLLDSLNSKKLLQEKSAFIHGWYAKTGSDKPFDFSKCGY